MADEGWAGKWEPHEVDSSTLGKLQDLAGEPVPNPRTGKPLELMTVNLRTGEVVYPARR